MTIIREFYLYLTKVIFMLKHCKITSLYKLGDVAACRAACVLCALHATHMPLYLSWTGAIREENIQKFEQEFLWSELQNFGFNNAGNFWFLYGESAQ